MAIYVCMYVPPPVAVKRYNQMYLPYVCDQPPIKRDVIASLIEKNAEEYVAQQEWELEWNRAGLASRLSEEVCVCVCVCVYVHVCVRVYVCVCVY